MDPMERFKKALKSFEQRKDFHPHKQADWIKFIATHKFPVEERTVYYSDTLNSLLATVTTDLNLSDPLIFLMELLQNAEDNKYDGKCPPSFEIFLSRVDPTDTPGSQGCITVVNNETGFSDADVWNLCDAGVSFKKRQKEQKAKAGSTDGDFIGEKGLGFKTTFRLSDDPHIFSNGFNFKLSSRGKIGYIVPTVVDSRHLLAEVGRIADGQKTVIMLPLNKTSFEEIASNLQDFARSPMVILFLKKMAFIRVHIQGERSEWRNVFIEKQTSPNPYVVTIQTIRRSSKGDADKSERAADKLGEKERELLSQFCGKTTASRRVALECLNRAKWNVELALARKEEVMRDYAARDGPDAKVESHTFFVHHRDVIKPPEVTRPADDYRVKNAVARVVSVALPLLRELPDDWTPRYSTLCAYLPTNIQTGWKFILNADFCLVASREGLSEYSADLKRTGHWNSWLLSEVATSFVSAFEELQLATEAPPYITRDTKRSAFAVIPVDVNSRFKRVFDSIVEQLKSREVMLVQGQQGEPAYQPSRVRFAGSCCVEAGIQFPGHEMLVADAPLERRNRKVLELLGVAPMKPGEWFKFITANLPWIAGMDDVKLLAILDTLRELPADSTVPYFSDLAFIPSDANTLIKPSKACLGGATFRADNVRASLVRLLNDPRGRGAKEFLVTLGGKTADTKGFAREYRTSLLELHNDQKHKPDVAEYVDAIKNLLVFATMPMADLTDVLSGMPFATWAGEFITRAKLEQEGLVKPLWMPLGSDPDVQVMVKRPADWPGLVLLHDRYNGVIETGKQLETRTTANPALLVLHALGARSLCRPVGPGIDVPFVLLKKGEPMPLKLPAEQFINEGQLFARAGKKWTQGQLLKVFTAPAFLFDPKSPVELMKPQIVRADAAKGVLARCEAYLHFLEGRVLYFTPPPAKMNKKVAADLEPFHQVVVGKAEATLTESMFCVATRRSAWVCVEVGGSSSNDPKKLLLLTPSLVFDLAAAPREVGLPVVPWEMIRTPDASKDPRVVKDYVDAKLRGLFLKVEPRAVVEWIDAVVQDPKLDPAVKGLLLRPDQLSKAYRYLLEEHQLALVKQVVVRGELVPIERLIWLAPPFALPESAVVPLAAVYPPDMRDVFVRELSVPEHLNPKLALRLWKEDVEKRLSPAPSSGSDEQLFKRSWFFLTAIADGAHLLGAEVETVPLLNALKQPRKGVCLLAETSLLYNRLSRACPILAYMPPVLQAADRRSIMNLYNRRKSMLKASTAVVFSLPEVPRLHKTPPGASEYWGPQHSFRVLEAMNIICQTNLSHKKLPVIVREDFDIFGQLRILPTKNVPIALRFAIAAKKIEGECEADSFLDLEESIIYLKCGASRPRNPTQLQWDTVARELGSLFDLSDEEIVNVLQPAIKFSDVDWNAACAQNWATVTPVDPTVTATLTSILQASTPSKKGAEEEEEEEEQEEVRVTLAKTPVGKTPVGKTPVAVKRERGRGGKEGEEEEQEEEEEDEEEGDASSVKSKKKKGKTTVVAVAAQAAAKGAVAPIPVAAAKAAASPIAVERPTAAAPTPIARTGAKTAAEEAKKAAAANEAVAARQLRANPASSAKKKAIEEPEGEGDKPTRKRLQGSKKKSRATKVPKVQEEDDDVPLHLPENWDNAVTFSSMVRYEDDEALRHSNRLNPNVSVQILPRGHLAYRPHKQMRGVFAAKDLDAGRVIGINAGLVRWANGEEEEVSDYFMSYGQTNTDVAIYDLDSERYGNELRFLNSNFGMNVPANVRVEGRVIDIVFVNLPCVITTRDVKRGEELLLDYEVQEDE